MYEYHGWLTLSCDTYEEDDVSLQTAINNIRDYVDKLNWVTGKIEIYAVNGQFHLCISGFDNHKPIEKYNPVNILEYIAERAKGSYGMLYIRDSENNQSHNCFKVYVLARGELSEKEDMYLSPCNPIIED